MIALIIFCVAMASAIPLPSAENGKRPQHKNHPYYKGDLFLVGKFWSDLNPEFLQVDVLLANFHRLFPSKVSSEGIDGREYEITVPLPGFSAQDIIVKAREVFVAIQAVRKNESDQKNYVDIRSLPDNVDLKGRWWYNNDVLKIVFPLKAEDTGSQTAVTTPSTVDSITYPVDVKDDFELLPMRY